MFTATEFSQPVFFQLSYEPESLRSPVRSGAGYGRTQRGPSGSSMLLGAAGTTELGPQKKAVFQRHSCKNGSFPRRWVRSPSSLARDWICKTGVIISTFQKFPQDRTSEVQRKAGTHSSEQWLFLSSFCHCHDHYCYNLSWSLSPLPSFA